MSRGRPGPGRGSPESVNFRVCDLSTTATTYTLRTLYEGADGRDVRVAFAKQTDAWLYDTSGFVADPTAVTTVPADGSGLAGDEIIRAEATKRAEQGTKHTRSSVVVDRFGNRIRQIAFGEVGTDETIITATEPTPTLEIQKKSTRVERSSHHLGVVQSAEPVA